LHLPPILFHNIIAHYEAISTIRHADSMEIVRHVLVLVEACRN
jgi:hypothetical protein